MKKLKLLSLFAAAAAVLLGCSKEIADGGAQGGERITSVTATSGVTSKISIDTDQASNKDVLTWAADDKIVFFEIADAAEGTYVKEVKEVFKLISGAGTKEATFVVDEGGNGLDPQKKYRAFHVSSETMDKIFVASNNFIHYDAIPMAGSGWGNGPRYTYASVKDRADEKYAIFSGEVTFEGDKVSVDFNNNLCSFLEVKIEGAAGFEINRIELTGTGSGNNFFSLLEIKGDKVQSGYSGQTLVINFDTPFKAGDGEVLRIPMLHRFKTDQTYSFTLKMSNTESGQSATESKERNGFEYGKTYVWDGVWASPVIDKTLDYSDWKLAASTYYSDNYAPASIFTGTNWLTKEYSSGNQPSEWWGRMPQWVLMDMREVQRFNQFYLSRRGGSTRDTKMVEIYASKNYTGEGVVIPDTPPTGAKAWAGSSVTEQADKNVMEDIRKFVEDETVWTKVSEFEFGDTSGGPDNSTVGIMEGDYVEARWLLVKITKCTGRGGKVVAGGLNNFKVKYYWEDI